MTYDLFQDPNQTFNIIYVYTPLISHYISWIPRFGSSLGRRTLELRCGGGFFWSDFRWWKSRDPWKPLGGINHGNINID